MRGADAVALLSDRAFAVADTLATAYALNGDADSALVCLDRIAEMGLTAPAREDSSFIALAGEKRFKSALDRLDANTQPTMTCRIAFTLPQQDLVPEGLAYEPGSRSFFVSSVRDRKIMRYQRGEITRFAGGPADSLWSMMGMKLDASRGRLWVATAAIREGRGLPAKDLGRTGVLAFDIRTGALSSARILPEDGAQHLFGDLTLDAHGDVLVTDSAGGGLYRVQADAGHEVLAQLSGRMRRFRIKVVAGDRVTVSVSPYDLVRGIITFRAR